MGEANRHVIERHASEHQHEHELRQADHHQSREDHAERRKHEQHDREGKNELEHPAVGVKPGKDGRQDVVDDERDRVRQVEEVRERPDPAVNERRLPSGRGLDESGQAAGRHDPPRVHEPEGERRREDRECEHDDETCRCDPLIAGRPRQEVRQREWPTDRRDRETDEEERREPLGSTAVCWLSLHGYLYPRSVRSGFRNPAAEFLR